MLCGSLCCFFSKPFRAAVFLRRLSLDLHCKHPMCPSREWGVADEGKLECQSCVTVVRASRRGSSNISMGIDLEHSGNSAER